MFGLLSRLLGRPDRLTRLAHGPDRAAFAAEFARADVWFLCLPPQFAEGLDPAAMTAETLQAQIEAAARDLAGRTEFPPFIYEADGRRYLPVFGDQKRARKFVEWYAPRVNRVLPFQMLQVKGAVFAAAVPAGVTVVLNDRSPHARELTPDDLALVRGAGG